MSRSLSSLAALPWPGLCFSWHSASSMGDARRRAAFLAISLADYSQSVTGCVCPNGCTKGALDVVDLYTTLPLFEEPTLPRKTKTGESLPRYLCAVCYTEWDQGSWLRNLGE